MATYNKHHIFVSDLGRAQHDFFSHTFRVVLTLTAPTSANSDLANLTQVTASNGYPSGGLTASVIVATESAGVFRVTLEDVSFTASGGDLPLFRYVDLYNDTASADPLIAFWDFGSTANITSGNSFLVDFPTTASGVFSIT